MKILFALLLAASAHAGEGFYKVAKDASGRWHWISPSGKPFFSKACGVVNPKDGAVKPGAPGYDVLPKYGNDKNKWADATLKRLKRYGFNSLGSWSDDALYDQSFAFTHILALAGYDDDRLVGVWSEPFRQKIEAQALKETARWKGSKELLGYYFDNELPWYGDKGWPGPHNTPLIGKYMALPAGTDKSMAVKALAQHFKNDLKALEASTGIKAKAWNELESRGFARGSVDFPPKLQMLFMGWVAEQYFKSCRAAALKADPNHLLLGVRFAGTAPDPVIIACGRYSDVISVNQYSKSGQFQFGVFDRIHVLSQGKPLLLTEFSFRAMENRSGNKNTLGADVTVATQKDRAEHLKTFLGGALTLPYLIGYHWFSYSDESPEGRTFDGEDSNYGLVDIHDREYEELRQAFIEINRGAEAAHAAASHVVPADAATSKEVRLREILGATGAKLEARRTWIDFSKEGGERLLFWNDPSAKAQFQVKGLLDMQIDSGKGWGLGWSFKPKEGSSSSALGYPALEVEIKVEQGKKFHLFADESGIGEPYKGEYAGDGGADGEGWESRPLTGTGDWMKLKLDLLEFATRGSWGNQDGNKVVDLQALATLGLYFGGNQGSFKAQLRRLDFVR